MSIETLNDFREKYNRFLKWLPYMREKRMKMENKMDKFANIMNDFIEKVQNPMDEAWSKLTDYEKEMF
jgi:hypothetical protein